MEFGILDQAVDLILGQAAGGCDLDRLGLACGHVLGGHIDDAVRVDVEGHFDLGQTAGGGLDPHEFESAQGLVVRSHLALTLEHMDRDRRLVVFCR